MLKELRPRIASFYILTPIPGTAQYDEFRAAGLITEQNLDRFDGSCCTWAHPRLSRRQLEDFLYQCYTNYYGFLLKSGGLSDDDLRFAVFCRYTAAHRKHPMAGGIEQLQIDGAKDYAELRRVVYDLDLVPLPDSLGLSANDEELNRKADWRVRHVGASHASQ